ncbi:MAG: hypothetical protein JSW23_08240 [Planctomycetota bacterium]|nr:MAG: hypothetical protein JSW23_08240 [Planctomycetota bacterium]
MNKSKRFGRFILIMGVAAAMVCLYLAQAALAETIGVDVQIRPKHIRLSDDNPKPYINCNVVIPDGYDPADITSCTMDVVGTEVKAKNVKICVNDPQRVVGLFDLDTVCSILDGTTGNVELGVTIVLGETTFVGSDTIKVSE